MRCKNCGDIQPDPEPVVKVIEKRVESPDVKCFTRVAAGLMVVLLTLIGSCTYTDHKKYATLEKLMKDPSVKFKHMEYSSGTSSTEYSK